MHIAETTVSDNRQARYRRRLAAAGKQEVLLRLSNETVALIDELKERQGLRNRGQVFRATHSNGENSRPAANVLETEKPALPGGLSKLVTGLTVYVGDKSQPPT